jgi:hypothetical protein
MRGLAPSQAAIFSELFQIAGLPFPGVLPSLGGIYKFTSGASD